MIDFVSVAKFSEITGLHITKTHTGKMLGKRSLSTSVVENPICKQRRLNGNSVCAKCYAAKMLNGIYKKDSGCFVKNFELLQKPLKTVPIFPKHWKDFRFEAFGDIASETQFHNYCLIARANPNVTFAIWSKNLWIMDRVFKYESKPKNLIIIQSSVSVNKAEEPKYWFVDKVFTVYSDRETAKELGVKINCEAKRTHKRCADCNKCYNLKNKTKYINEILK